MAKPRILLWDIESSQLNADYGAMLCVGYKYLGEPKKTVKVVSTQDLNGVCECCERIKNPCDDRALLEYVYPILANADGWITWFGEFFDERFVNTRLLYHGMKPLPPVSHIDGWRTARYKLRMSSNRLKTIQAFLGLPDAKTAIRQDAWLGALNGDMDSMRYIIDHCELDVHVLEQAYNRLLPLITKHPNMGLFLGEDRVMCSNCGSKSIQYRGQHLTNTRAYRRYQCQKCGKWGRESKSVARASGKGL